jgi:hypothetical protein
MDKRVLSTSIKGRDNPTWDGRLRCYFLKDPIIPDIIELLKKDYIEELPAPACCPVTKKGKYPGKRRH